MLIASAEHIADYNAGWNARRAGQPVAACPHAPGPSATTWLSGFDAADGWSHADDDSTPITVVGLA